MHPFIIINLNATQMTSIKVKFRPSSVDEKSGSIYYQIIHNRIPRQIVTDYRVNQDEWDEKRSMVTTTQVSERKALILSIRDRIRWDVERLNKIIGKLTEKAIDFTADDVVEEFKRYRNEYSFFNYMENAVARQKQNGKITTADNYRSALNSFKKFRDNEDIMLDCLTSEIMEQYEAWQKSRGIIPNTISFYTRIFRAVYKRAVEDEVIVDRHPFRRVYTGVDKTVKRALSLKLIRKIKSIDLSLFPKLDFARDMFILSFYFRGMSFVDMAYLKKSDLKDGEITYRRRKTSQQLSIGWTKEMQAIVDKYPDNESDYLLPIITRKGVNERSAYLNMSYRINSCLKKIAVMVASPVKLTMYTARHSWASIAKAKGVPLSVISEGMGHDSEATTQIYLASLDTSVVDKANDLIISSL